MLQEVVTNLMISRIEVRGEEDADVAAYRHATAREVRVVRPSREVDAARSILMQSFRRIMDQLAHSKVRRDMMLCEHPFSCSGHSSHPNHRPLSSQAVSPYCSVTDARLVMLHCYVQS